MRRGRGFACVSVLVVSSFVTLLSALAHAEATAAERALAMELFDRAEALMAAGAFADACPKYRESQRLDPQLGVLLYLGDCLEKNGQLASAWLVFREATELAQRRGDERAPMASARATSLVPRLSRLQIDVAAAEPGLLVYRDGIVLAASSWGEALAVDAGSHRISASAPGHADFERTLEVAGEGSVVRLSLPQLTPSAAPAALEPVPGSTPTPLVADAATPAGGTARAAALGLGGAGLVAMGVGAYLGLRANGTWNDANGRCNARGVCDERGIELRERARTEATSATVTVSLGAAALGGALLLWFTAPRASEKRSAGLDAASLSSRDGQLEFALLGRFQ